MKRNYRHELKYVLSEDVAKMLALRLSATMEKDSHSISNDYSYFIRSLYFDTIDSDAYSEKMDGVQFRKKYRLRYYNLDDRFIKLECKHKHDQLTFKEASSVSKEWVDALLHTPEKLEVTSSDTLVDRFLMAYKYSVLTPSVIVDYYRQAFVFEPLDVRVTLDYHVSSGVFNRDLFDANLQGVEVFEQNQVVLEVKFNEILPDHIWLVLQTVPSLRMAISKFAYCRSVL